MAERSRETEEDDTAHRVYTHMHAHTHEQHQALNGMRPRCSCYETSFTLLFTPDAADNGIHINDIHLSRKHNKYSGNIKSRSLHWSICNETEPSKNICQISTQAQWPDS